MKQTQKILIGLISFLCGSPIVFLTLKDNQQKKKKKNLSLVKKKKRMKSNKKSFFWTILIIVIVVCLVIIFKVIYKMLKKKVDELDKQKKSFKSHLSCIQNSCLEIIFANENIYDINHLNKYAINNILEADLDELKKLGIKEEAIPEQLKGTLKKLLKMIANYLTTYLTSQFLGDLYQENKTDKTNYNILTTMAELITKDENYFCILLYSKLLPSEKSSREANEKQKNYLQKNKLLNLLESVLLCGQSTFVKYQVKEKTEIVNETAILFPNLYILVKLFEQIHFEISSFFQKQIDKNNQQKKYEKLLTKLQTSYGEIEKLMYPITFRQSKINKKIIC